MLSTNTSSKTKNYMYFFLYHIVFKMLYRFWHICIFIHIILINSCIRVVSYFFIVFLVIFSVFVSCLILSYKCSKLLYGHISLYYLIELYLEIGVPCKFWLSMEKRKRKRKIESWIFIFLFKPLMFDLFPLFVNRNGAIWAKLIVVLWFRSFLQPKCIG